MPICYDKLFARFKENNITTYVLRNRKILGEKTLTSIREGRPIRTDVLCRLCYLLNCRLEDIIEYVPNKADVLTVSGSSLSLPSNAPNE